MQKAPALANSKISGLVGAAVPAMGRYIKFVDGSIMVGGKFADTKETVYSSLYSSTNKIACFMIDQNGIYS